MVILDEGGTSSQALLMTSGRAERDRADAVIDQFLHQFAAGHARITDREVKTIGDWLVEIMIIYDLETVIREDLFQSCRSPSVFLDLRDKVE